MPFLSGLRDVAILDKGHKDDATDSVSIVIHTMVLKKSTAGIR